MLWITVSAARRRAPMAPTTTAGRVALASLASMAAVVATDGALWTTVPAGALMHGLAVYARVGRRDPGHLVVLPLVFGAWVLVLPLLVRGS